MNHRNAPPLNVLVRHAEPLLSAGLVSALQGQHDFEVRAYDAVDPGWPADVVITDYQQGIRLACADPYKPGTAPNVMVVTPQCREHDVRLALESGVRGYLLVGCLVDELAAAVHLLGRGQRYLGMEVSQRMADSLTREALTAREAEVLSLLVGGLCNKSIAARLTIRLGTVKAHVRGIMAKLDASSRTQAAAIAAQRGLVQDAPTAAWRMAQDVGGRSWSPARMLVN